MRSTKAAFGLVAVAAFLLTSCAYVVDPDPPTVVTALSQDQLATLHLKGIVSTAAPGMGQENLTRLTEAVRTEIAFESPGIFVEEPKAPDSHALTMKLQFTTYSFFDADAEFIKSARDAGFVGSITSSGSGCKTHAIAADVQLVDDNNIVKGLYHVGKYGDISCLFTIDVVTSGFAKNVAEIVKNGTAESIPHKKKLDEPITGLNTTPQLNGRIALLLTPSFANYWMNAPLRSLDRLSLGETLSNNASDSMRALFRDLKIVYGPLPAGSPPTLVLVPKVTSAYAGIGRGRFGDRPVSITIQWTLKNQNGVEIWHDTVRGDAHGDLAGVASGPVDSWMHDFGIAAAKAFRTSKERMGSSPEVLTALKAVQ